MPRAGESLASSTTMISRRLAWATIFSCRRAPPPPLMSVEVRVDLVRPVDGDVDHRVVGEGGEGHVEPPGLGLGLGRRRDGDDVTELAGGEQGGDLAHGPDRGRAGAEADHHPRRQEARGVLGGGTLQAVALVHLAGCIPVAVIVPLVVVPIVPVVVVPVVLVLVVVVLEPGGVDEGLEVVLLAADEPRQLGIVVAVGVLPREHGPDLVPVHLHRVTGLSTGHTMTSSTSSSGG